MLFKSWNFPRYGQLLNFHTNWSRRRKNQQARKIAKGRESLSKEIVENTANRNNIREQNEVNVGEITRRLSEQNDMNRVQDQMDDMVSIINSDPGWKTAKFYKILYVTEHFLKDFGWYIQNFPCLNFVCCCDVFQVSSKNFVKSGGVL